MVTIASRNGVKPATTVVTHFAIRPPFTAFMLITMTTPAYVILSDNEESRCRDLAPKDQNESLPTNVGYCQGRNSRHRGILRYPTFVVFELL